MALNALRNLFAKPPTDVGATPRAKLVGPRIPRPSTGWAAMLKHLQEEEALQVLDIGPTSASNINLLTSLGHSLYMSDLVVEAQPEEWQPPLADDPDALEASTRSFLDKHLDFGGRRFDVILLWTTLDYVPEPLVAPLIARLHTSLNPRGRILAFFHVRLNDDERIFYRYHVTAGANIELQEAQRLALRQVYTTRKIEKLFSAFAEYKFFLAKDNLAEVIITR